MTLAEKWDRLKGIYYWHEAISLQNSLWLYRALVFRKRTILLEPSEI